MTKIYGKFMAKVIRQIFDCFFILAARIAFWVYLLIKIENFVSYTN
jgi:hypothetical protein